MIQLCDKATDLLWFWQCVLRAPPTLSVELYTYDCQLLKDNCLTDLYLVGLVKERQSSLNALIFWAAASCGMSVYQL
jgi:hypothetical protein